jgi:NADPH-dependent glutamate synthase beta subunit-like oxidoreductase/NAD(P)H-flavin reductase
MDLQLSFNLQFSDLYSTVGLKKIDTLFINYLREARQDLYLLLTKARINPATIDEKTYSYLIIECGKYLDSFISDIFQLGEGLNKIKLSHKKLDPLYICKKIFIQKRASKKYTKEEASFFDFQVLQKSLLSLLNINEFQELEFAIKTLEWLEQVDEEKLDIAVRYTCAALYTEAGKQFHHDSILFKLPSKLNFDHLVDISLNIEDKIEILKAPENRLTHREGFTLTDHGSSLEYILDQTNYCIHCHNQSKDSCSKGIKDKEENYTTSFFNTKLTGCPLEEKISEMNFLKSQAYIIASLAAITIDNPMVAATGHRICNDCMKSCIYQKQDPVNIPEIETKVLKDVLNLPWGFEIYSLLTRWNPLNILRPYPKADSNYKVLVVGLGPAGFTLSHHLLNDGHIVVGIDGLKIEPLPQEISGIDIYGTRSEYIPVYDIHSLFDALDQRIAQGFGGVQEYGITARWNKNYLTIIRLLLERRENFRMYGGTRFGSNITYYKAWELGFDHIALAIGSGKPNLLSIPNSLAKGIRTSSDFLMSLQSAGALRKNSIANLQIRLPLVVIGGGLTAIDSATEALAYYPIQLEKFYERYHHIDSEKFYTSLSDEDKNIFAEYMSHASELVQEKTLAKSEGRQPNLLPLLKKWGGVKILYRRGLRDSPSYRLNAEEVNNAFKEGIEFLENTEIVSINLDKYENITNIHINQNGLNAVLPANNILLALGTHPNTVLAREYPSIFKLHHKYFNLVNDDQEIIEPERNPKPKKVNIITSIDFKGRAISVFGDAHPSYAGNVVKAMASAKQGYPQISTLLSKLSPSSISRNEFFVLLDSLLIATIHSIEYLTPNILELKIKAPLATQEFQPGQFYKLQNFESLQLDKTLPNFGMEALAMTGAIINKEENLISIIALEMGGSSSLCSKLQSGEPVILMGPTGHPTYIPCNEKVLLIGGGLGNAVLLSIGQAMKSKNCEVLYLAGYKKAADRYKVKEIEEAGDVIIWACEEKTLAKNREQDRSYVGNVIEAITLYNQDENFGGIQLNQIDRIIAIGSASMMQAISNALSHELKTIINPKCHSIGSINSPMQCMMKEICAQCLQRNFDPETNIETYVYSCFNQDQSLKEVDFSNLQSRLKQNSLQEKLTLKWLEDFI